METRRRLLAVGIAAPFMSTDRHGANSISTLRLLSPNRGLEVAVTSDQAGRLTYSISFDHRVVLMPSPLGLDLGTQGTLSQALRIVRTTRTSVDQHYALVAGKSRYA